jgi:hypothetical protein
LIRLSAYYKSIRFISSLFIYNENKPPSFDIQREKYEGLNGENPPVKIILPKKPKNKVVILYPGASLTAEKHPKMDMLGRLLAQIGFTVYIPRIPPLKNLDISEINIQWFICFYQWILNVKKIDPQKIMMTGISYGGGIMLRAILELNDKLPSPKTILTYGTYSNGETMLKFLLNGEITIKGKIYRVSPHEWGLIVIFHNYLKNLPTDWDSKYLQQAIQFRIEENMEECDIQVKQLPEFQKNIFHSIIQRNLTPEVKELAQAIINKEHQALNNLSPSDWANQIRNKVFIIHGANDSMVPFTESIQLSEILPNSELFISHLYEHNEISTNRSIFFIFIEIIKFINFYAKLFTHYED